MKNLEVDEQKVSVNLHCWARTADISIGCTEEGVYVGTIGLVIVGNFREDFICFMIT